MNEICRLSAVELARKLRERELSPAEVVDAVFERIEQSREANAFVCTTEDIAREAAKQAEQALTRGEALPRLLGVPFSVKDVTNCEGVPTSNGSKALHPVVPEVDHVAVARARAAGAILVGKTTTPELAHKAHTISPLSGLTLNPYDTQVTCGGSSGGAAVAVALGMGPLALGTDGGGSVRIPAACCGVVGLKPSIGAVPDVHAQDLFGVTSQVGPMARSVADVRLFHQVLQGGHFHDPYSQAPAPASRACDSLQGVRVAWMPRCGNMALDHEVERLSLAAVRQMEAMGASVEEVEIDFAQLEPHFFVLMETGSQESWGVSATPSSTWSIPRCAFTYRKVIGTRRGTISTPWPRVPRRSGESRTSSALSNSLPRRPCPRLRCRSHRTRTAR